MRPNVLLLLSVNIMYVYADQNKTFVAGHNAVLLCEGIASASETYIWAENTFPSETRIYIVSKTVRKTEEAKGIEKYDNFFINSSYPKSVDMVIDSISLDDRGSYQCDLVIQSRTVTSYNVDVEVPPLSISIDCIDYSTCPVSSSDIASSIFHCTCEAVGAYPDTLRIQWDDVIGSPTNVTSSISGQDGTFDFSSNSIFRPHFIRTSISCQIAGFRNEIDISLTRASFTVYPPSCSLLATPSKNCSIAELSCNCNEAFPEVKSYTFYNKRKALIGYSVDSGVVGNVQISQAENETFYCRGCNGLFFGDRSLAQSTFTCNIDTTTTETTFISDPTTTRTKLMPDTTTTKTTSMSDTATARTTSMSDTSTSRTTPMSDLYTERTTVAGDLITSIFDGTTIFDGTSLLPQEEDKPCKTLTWLIVCSLEGLLVAMLIAYIVVIKCRKIRKGHPRRPIEESIDLNGIGEEISFTKTDSLKIRPKEILERRPIRKNGFMKYSEAIYNKEKVVKKFLCDDAPKNLFKIFNAEVKSVMQLPKHTNVVVSLYWCNTEPVISILECTGGETLLDHVFHRNNPRNEEDMKHLINMARQVACGMTFLHKHKFIHPGLRAERVLCSPSGSCKLFEFLSKPRAQELTSLLWGKDDPYQWMSPEYHKWKESTYANDAWSFGVLFWELVSGGQKPYGKMNKDEVLKQIENENYLERPENCSESIWQIVTNCWNNPGRRPSMEDIVDLLGKVEMCHIYEDVAD